jgi:hypothetical protein
VVRARSGHSARDKRASGLYDLRLFRDGQLVGWAPSGSSPSRGQTLSGESDGGRDDLRRWRASQKLRVSASGTARLSFIVRVPHYQSPREVVFSAYAFNEDRVKSANASKSFQITSQPGKPTGRAYVINIGINSYEHEAWDLRFAASDARRFEQALTRLRPISGQAYQVVPILLTSDYCMGEGQKCVPRIVTQSLATRDNIKAVVDVMAGRAVAPAI